MQNKFIITVPCYNCSEWIIKCLDSIYNQTFKNYQVVIIDDGSTDDTLFKITDWLSLKNDSRFNLIVNKINLGSPIGSIVQATDSLALDDEDIIVNVDGDDWLPDSEVFAYLDKVYSSNSDVWMTYGQFEPMSKSYATICAKVPNTKTYRKSHVWLAKMYASHLRTYKKKAFDKINRDDFMDFNNKSKYLQFAGDMALLFGLLEICGNNRSVFIDRIMYIYNDRNSLSEMYKNPTTQMNYAKMIADKPSYKEFNEKKSDKIDIIIYSRNRATQLDLLLRSIKFNFKNANNVIVLNDYDSIHYQAYQKVWSKDYGLNTSFAVQTRPTFYNVLINILKNINTDYILPLCDDDVIVRNNNINGIINFMDDDTVGVCLRRSATLTNSYHTGELIPNPQFNNVDKFLQWNWRNQNPLRWGYPYQAGGMIYDKEFFEFMMNNIKFDLPNYMEYQMMQNKDKWGKEKILCFEKSSVVNVSVNKVQSDVNNRAGRDFSYSVEELAKKFINNEIIDFSRLQNYENNCEFIEIPLDFVRK
jgi:glycosyltransferase involved in cell wall biosynthesis